MDLRDWLVTKLPADADIASLVFFCSMDLLDRVLCLISLRNVSAAEVMRVLGGQAFGLDSVVVSLPIGSRFTCLCRPQGMDMTTRSCSCNPGGQPAPSVIDDLD
jgi:hypothetical protein